MKKIRFKQDWRYSRQGDVIKEGDGVAELLIQRGIAEEVPAEEIRPAPFEAEEDVLETQSEQSDGELNGDPPLPQILTRRVPGPNENTGRRGGRG